MITQLRVWGFSNLYSTNDYSPTTRVTYESNFGDGWEFDIFYGAKPHDMRREVMGGKDYSPNDALCIFGQGHPAAEDYGGTYGWKVLRELFENPSMPDPEGRREWHMKICANGSQKGLDLWK